MAIELNAALKLTGLISCDNYQPDNHGWAFQNTESRRMRIPKYSESKLKYKPDNWNRFKLTQLHWYKLLAVIFAKKCSEPFAL